MASSSIVGRRPGSPLALEALAGAAATLPEHWRAREPSSAMETETRAVFVWNAESPLRSVRWPPERAFDDDWSARGGTIPEGREGSRDDRDAGSLPFSPSYLALPKSPPNIANGRS